MATITNYFIWTSKLGRRFILLFIDLLLIFSRFLFSGINLLSFSNSNFNSFFPLLIFLFLSIFVYILFGQYKGITIYKGSFFFYGILIRNIFLLFCSITIFPIEFISSKDFLFILFSLVLSQSFLRLIFRDLLLKIISFKNPQQLNVVIYGAGAAGAQLSASLKISKKYSVIAFVDDDPRKWGRTIWGFPIRSNSFLKENESNIDLLLLAIPSLDAKNRVKLLRLVTNSNFDVKLIPSIDDITSGKYNINSIKNITIDDILGRQSVEPSQDLLSSRISGNVVLVTGAGGSIGSELCKQIVNLNPKKLIILDNSEFNLYTISNFLENIKNDNSVLITILGNASNKSLLQKIYLDHKVDIVLHAAAYKHVPIVEDNPIEGVFNNVFTTRAVCETAINNNVSQVVLISTDKAVRPTNYMGASKRLAELIVQSYNNEYDSVDNIDLSSRTIFSIVRFGNVLDSSGSVVPLFRKQIASGGPITITHPKITRYFMTIKEASQLVIQSLGLSFGGEIFLLDMGNPIYIKELAEQMIKLSGLTIKDDLNKKGDIKIEYIGLRKGEKLNEELLISGSSTATSHPLIFCAHEKFIPANDLWPKLDNLYNAALELDISNVSNILKELVPEWQQQNSSS